MRSGEATPGPALAFERLSKSYGDVKAVDALDLGIAPGSFVALVGASGSGKSTLLKMINRLVEPSAGRVLIGGEDVGAMEPYRLRRSIGYIFQNIGLFPHMTVAQNILIGARLDRDADVDADRVSELLELVDLPPDHARRMPSELSGGQQQRVGVARALAMRPGLMLMDEPFGALDPVTRDRLGSEYRALHERLGLTTVMVTHDMAEALLIADRVLVMDAGRLVADATPAELVNGKAGAVAEAMVAIPREQAERMVALEEKSV